MAKTEELNVEHVVLLTGLKPKTPIVKKHKTGCRYNSHVELSYNKKLIIGTVKDHAQNKGEIYRIEMRMTKKETDEVKGGKDFLSTTTAEHMERELNVWMDTKYPNHKNSHAYWPQQ